MRIGGRIYARQGGKSKKEAEQRAAASALFLIEAEIFDPSNPPPADENKGS